MKISKRELSVAIILYKRYGGLSVNLGLVVDSIREELGVPRRTAINIVKRLKKLGLLKIKAGERGIEVILRKPCEVIEEYAMKYLEGRRTRRKGLKLWNRARY